MSTVMVLPDPSPALTSLGAGAEELVVRRAQAGDGEARDELATRCRRSAYLFALQLLGHPDDAVEVAQEALLRLFRSLSRFDARRPVKPWLFRLVRNLVVDQRRRRRVRREQPLDAALAAVLVDPPERGGDPEAQAQRREVERAVWRALCALSPPHRDILVLRDHQDLSYAEIAGVLGIPVGTVMSRLHAARRSLRAELGGSWLAPAPPGTGEARS